MLIYIEINEIQPKNLARFDTVNINVNILLKTTLKMQEKQRQKIVFQDMFRTTLGHSGEKKMSQEKKEHVRGCQRMRANSKNMFICLVGPSAFKRNQIIFRRSSCPQFFLSDNLSFDARLRHSDATTVAILIKIRIFQFCFLQWVTNDTKRLKEVIEQNRTAGGYAGAACQLLPKGA